MLKVITQNHSACEVCRGAMKTYGGVDIYTHVLTSALLEVSGQLHALAALPPGERAPGTHWIRGWVGPRAGLDDMKE
jgi:hypothetical protein